MSAGDYIFSNTKKKIFNSSEKLLENTSENSNST